MLAHGRVHLHCVPPGTPWNNARSHNSIEIRNRLSNHSGDRILCKKAAHATELPFSEVHNVTIGSDSGATLYFGDASPSATFVSRIGQPIGLIRRNGRMDKLVTAKRIFLLQVSKCTPSWLFSFMNPIAVEIWLSLLGAYVMVSLTIWIVARLSPYEWVEPSPCPSCKCPLQVGSRRVVQSLRSIDQDVFSCVSRSYVNLGIAEGIKYNDNASQRLI